MPRRAGSWSCSAWPAWPAWWWRAKGRAACSTGWVRSRSWRAGLSSSGSLVAYYAEHPTNREFATVGDALWWGIVTLTTVGYGDIVPKTATGRWAAVTIMITGVAVLGMLAGSLASFFRLDGGETADASPTGEPASTAATSNDAALEALTTEVSALRRQVEALTERVDRSSPGLTSKPARGCADVSGGVRAERPR